MSASGRLGCAVRLVAALAAVAVAGCQRRTAPSEGAEARGPAGRGSAVASATAPATTARPAGSGEAAGLQYVERQSGGAADEALPMVVAVHGLGDTPEHLGDALVSALERPARIILPRGPKTYGRGYSWFDLGSNEAMLAGIERATALVAGGLGELVKRRPTRGKPIVLGFSQGGTIAFALGAKHPALVGAAFPVAGLLPPPLVPPPGSGALPPFVAFHGADDRVVPAQLARESVERLKAIGARAEVHVYDGLGHSVSPELRNDLRREVLRALDAAGR
ncbi:MAG TPA: dienelactone hydrolase family protein [Polyangiaceae bacterium]|nr:dienelactone hydrolase family protein [Polyangiaceae bacterium]